MVIESKPFAISELTIQLSSLLVARYGLLKSEVDQSINKRIVPLISNLKDSLWVWIEHPYVDKVYRDSYYFYYSSKLGNYYKDCIRFSLFEKKIENSDFRNKENHDLLTRNYRGFVVVRPTIPNILGRNIISPLAFKNNGFIICSNEFPATANSNKFNVRGFPHSSQDSETISCAETSIWGIMEYFGTKYAEYKPVLPSNIISVLNELSYERQIPSKGLYSNQLSYALRKFGFGTVLYSRKAYSDIENILGCYIESGIPCIVVIQSTKIAHAILCLGHENVENSQYDTSVGKKVSLLNGIKIIDNDNVYKKFVFNDDNLVPYSLAHLNKPADNYARADWQSCQITNIIVPLYSKIYLDAFKAKHYIRNLLSNSPIKLPNNSEVYLRMFLASSRSYKHYLSMNVTFNDSLKELILSISLPKFIWVAEISTLDLIKKKQANGIVILDATEANTSMFFTKPLILACYNNSLLVIEQNPMKTVKNDLTLQPFNIFENNLN